MVVLFDGTQQDPRKTCTLSMMGHDSTSAEVGELVSVTLAAGFLICTNTKGECIAMATKNFAAFRVVNDPE